MRVRALDGTNPPTPYQGQVSRSPRGRLGPMEPCPKCSAPDCDWKCRDWRQLRDKLLPPGQWPSRRTWIMGTLSAIVVTTLNRYMQPPAPVQEAKREPALLEGKADLTAHAKGDLSINVSDSVKTTESLTVRRVANATTSNVYATATPSHINSCFSCEPVIRLPDYLTPPS
jgi:hypothetical protein